MNATTAIATPTSQRSTRRIPCGAGRPARSRGDPPRGRRATTSPMREVRATPSTSTATAHAVSNAPTASGYARNDAPSSAAAETDEVPRGARRPCRERGPRGAEEQRQHADGHPGVVQLLDVLVAVEMAALQVALPDRLHDGRDRRDDRDREQGDDRRTEPEHLAPVVRQREQQDRRDQPDQQVPRRGRPLSDAADHRREAGGHHEPQERDLPRTPRQEQQRDPRRASWSWRARRGCGRRAPLGRPSPRSTGRRRPPAPA